MINKNNPLVSLHCEMDSTQSTLSCELQVKGLLCLPHSVSLTLLGCQLITSSSLALNLLHWAAPRPTASSHTLWVCEWPKAVRSGKIDIRCLTGCRRAAPWPGQGLEKKLCVIEENMESSWTVKGSVSSELQDRSGQNNWHENAINVYNNIYNLI